MSERSNVSPVPKLNSTILLRGKKTDVMKAISRPHKPKKQKKFLDYFKSIDVYGEKIRFTYKGEKSYKTLVGAIFTSIQRIIILIFIAYELYVLFNRKHPMTFTKHNILDLNTYGQFDLRESGFDIAFGFDSEIDYSYGYFQVQQISQNKNSIQTEACSEKFTNQKDFYRYGINQMKCIKKESDLLLQGDQYSDAYSYIDISFVQCISTTNQKCKTQSEIESYLTGKQLKVFYLNNNFDFGLYESNPIQQYIDDSVSLYIDPSRNKQIQMFISPAQTVQYDNIFMFWDFETVSFFQVNKVIQNEKLIENSKIMASIQIKLDKKKLNIKRQVQDFFQFLEKIGGFKEAIFPIILLFVFFWQDRLFKGSFFRQLYQTKNKPETIPEIPISNGSIPFDKEITSPKSNQDNELFRQESIFPSQSEMATQLQGKYVLDDEDVQKIFHHINLRRRFHYGYKQAVQYLTSCMCFRRLKRYRHHDLLKKQFLFSKAHKKLESELDVITLLRSIRKLRLLSKILLTQRSRTLMKFSRKNVIESATSSSDSDDNKYDTMKLLDNKNDLVRASAIARIKRSLRHFQDNHIKDEDRELLKGIFIRRPKDFTEDVKYQIENDNNSLKNASEYGMNNSMYNSEIQSPVFKRIMRVGTVKMQATPSQSQMNLESVPTHSGNNGNPQLNISEARLMSSKRKFSQKINEEAWDEDDQ